MCSCLALQICNGAARPGTCLQPFGSWGRGPRVALGRNALRACGADIVHSSPHRRKPVIGRHRGNGDGDFLLSAPGSWLHPGPSSRAPTFRVRSPLLLYLLMGSWACLFFLALLLLLLFSLLFRSQKSGTSNDGWVCREKSKSDIYNR